MRHWGGETCSGLGLLLLVASAAAAQAPSRATIDDEPRARPGRAVTSWQSYQGPGIGGGESLALRVRNDTTVPILITNVRLLACSNIDRACEAFDPMRPVMAPGEVLNLTHFGPARSGHAMKVTFDVDWRVATECIGPRPALVIPGPSKPPENRVLNLPGNDLRDVPSKVALHITFFVAENGTVDSATVPELTKPKALAAFQRYAKTYRFLPALDGYGCPVPWAFEMQMTRG